MKVAIASTGNTPESNVDLKFGRCSCYVIYDTESRSVEYIPNPYKTDEESAGTSAVQLMVSRNVARIIAGEFGIKIKGLLDSLKIQLIIVKDRGKTIGEIIELLNNQTK